MAGLRAGVRASRLCALRVRRSRDAGRGARSSRVMWSLRWAHLGLGAALLCGEALVAQAAPPPRPQSPSPNRVTNVTITRVGAGNLCVQEEVEGERLARMPEGIALLRMRRELDAAARLATVRPVSGGEARQLTLVRREVDSLARVLEGVVLAAPRREALRSEVEVRQALVGRVRALAPQVDDVIEASLLRVAGTARPAPEGYLGMTVSSVPLRTSLQSGYIVSYCDYPVVESVEPGAPAERAGLVAGDTLLAFNGRDLRAGMVDYTALLVPNTSLRMRARRDGRTRDVTVQVAQRPAPQPVRVYARGTAPDGGVTVSLRGTAAAPVASAPSRDASVPASVLFGGTEAVSITRVPSAAFFGGAEAISPAGAPSAVFSVTTEAPAAVRPVGPPFPPGVTMVELAQVTRAASAPPNDAVSSVMMSSFVGVDDAFVGGAQLKTLSPDLRTALALPEGVLVLQVLRGTPAAESGLREGDLIRSANGQDVRRVDDVQRALVQGREQRALALRVARKGAAERTVTLRW